MTEYHRLPTMRVTSSLPRIILTTFGALVCIFAHAENTTILPPNVLDGGRENHRRELAAAGAFSFAYTGAYQTWY